jgi:hypothetical protein
MMGRKTLSEIKVELGLLGVQGNGKSFKAKPTVGRDTTEFEKSLMKRLAALEREIKKGRKSNAGRSAKR